MPRFAIQPVFLAAALLLASPGLGTAQAQDRVLGTITATGNGTVTIHPATGADVTVTLAPNAHILRTAPDAKSLAGATPIAATDLAVGDRVLAKLVPGGNTAALLVAMKSGDLAQQHETQAAAWRANGVAGVVATVEGGTITLKPHGTTPALIIHTTPATVYRRYSPVSTSFADTQPGKLTDVRPGDQLRARGARTGNDIAGEEIVAGSFQNIAGTVVSTDASANTLTLTDLATRHPVTLHVTPETQFRKLPEFFAKRLASHEAGGTPAAPHASGDSTEALLERAPVIQLGDLHKGDAVMIVASGPDAQTPSAITIIAGVEPLLSAPSGSSNELFSASWNLGGGGGGEAGGGPQ